MTDKYIAFSELDGDYVAIKAMQMPGGSYALSMASNDALYAARAGFAGCGKVNAKTGINAAATVLTDTGMLVAIPAGKQIVVPCFYAHLNTASDYVDFELGYTSVADGSGTFTALSPKFRIETGTAANTPEPSQAVANPPLVVKNSTGKAFTFRAQTNDASASVTFGFNYWLENET